MGAIYFRGSDLKNILDILAIWQSCPFSAWRFCFVTVGFYGTCEQWSCSQILDCQAVEAVAMWQSGGREKEVWRLPHRPTIIGQRSSANDHRPTSNGQTRYVESFGIGIAASVPQRTVTGRILPQRHNDHDDHDDDYSPQRRPYDGGFLPRRHDDTTDGKTTGRRRFQHPDASG